VNPVGHGETAEHLPVVELKEEPAGHIGFSEHLPVVELKFVHAGKDEHFLEVELYDTPTSHNGDVLQKVDTRFVP
jgi:hypothetical protein